MDINREIGSEFWKTDILEGKMIRNESDYIYLLSGRTALDFIIRDIKVSKNIKFIYMPSYCCYTMILPFLQNGISVEFYNVGFENGKFTYDIDFETKCDTILIMQYFGYCNDQVVQSIERLRKNGKTIIEDATHSWFSKEPYSYLSDYVFASLRKWTGIPCGAVAIKNYENFIIPISDYSNNNYIDIRLKAALLKKKYIEKNEGNKGKFLQLFSQAENLLDLDYQDYSIPKYYEFIIAKIDAEKIKKYRQTNANFLIEELSSFREIKTIFINSKDTPLFVPIIVNKGRRDELRQHLINNEIYCPVHWAISNEHKIDDFYLYKNSLSLVCDQRYDLSNMKRIIKCIDDFYGKGV